MRILISGGSGFLGQALCNTLLARGDDVIVWSRNPQDNARRKNASEWVSTLDEIAEPVDAVINLTGANLFSGIWTKSRKKTLRASRIEITETLMNWLGSQEKPPRVLLSGSAIGYYGDCGETIVNEAACKGDDWAAQLVADWEASTVTSTSSLQAMRTVYLRTGLVLGKGGLLQALQPVFKLGLGGSLGKGQFWYSWIHIQDWVNATVFLLDTESAQGPYNLSAPNPVRYGQFARALGQALHRPVWLTPPAWLLKLLLREQASLLMSSTNAMPERLQHAGFQWRHPEINEALEALS